MHVQTGYTKNILFPELVQFSVAVILESIGMGTRAVNKHGEANDQEFSSCPIGKSDKKGEGDDVSPIPKMCGCSRPNRHSHSSDVSYGTRLPALY